MNTKLTLRMDDTLVQRAKNEAFRRGKSVSKMVEQFFDSLAQMRRDERGLPPVTASLAGILKGSRISKSDYGKHLREKYLEGHH